MKEFETVNDRDVRKRQDEEDSQTRKNGFVGANLWYEVRIRKHVRHPTHQGASQHSFCVLTDCIGSRSLADKEICDEGKDWNQCR